MVKKPGPKTERSCGTCGIVYKFSANVNALQTTDKMIKHYETEHPDRMAYCFDTYGRTWNEQYDVALKGLWNYKGELTKLTAELKSVTDMRNSLAARLNAIIMILERKD